MTRQALEALIEEASIMAANQVEELMRAGWPPASPAAVRPVVVAVVAGTLLAVFDHLGRARKPTGNPAGG